jgi:hypothetical protein
VKAIIDNDVIFKGLKGDLLAAITNSIPGGTDAVGVLGAAAYVLDGLIRKCDSSMREILNARLAQFLENANLLEPTQDELLFAADLERLAQDASLPLDVGESQICAIAIIRSIPLVVTGDKRAIEAIERLFDHHVRLAFLTNRVLCLEQLVLRALTAESAIALRTAVCAGIKIDKTLSICFACHSNQVKTESIAECLNSYITDLRRKAHRVLAA